MVVVEWPLFKVDSYEGPTPKEGYWRGIRKVQFVSLVNPMLTPLPPVSPQP